MTESASKFDQAVALIESLSGQELNELKPIFDRCILGKPMILQPLPNSLKHLEGKFVIFDKGEVKDGGVFEDVYPDSTHGYELKWNDDDEAVDIKSAVQTGYMHAGSTSYEIQAFKFGDFICKGVFPEESGLPRPGVDGFEETELLDFILHLRDKRNVVDKKQFVELIHWLIAIVEGPTHLLDFEDDTNTAFEGLEGYEKELQEEEKEEEAEK